MKKTKTDLYTILTALFVGSLLISNVIASKTFMLFGFILPTAVIVFPIVYIINDVMAEVYGFKKARQTILVGFAANILAVATYNIAIILPAPVFAVEVASSMQVLLGTTFRVLIASMSAYLVGSLLNSYVMVKLKEKLSRYLMLRCVVSTLFGEGVDALIFISIVFYGSMPISALLTMILAQAAVKTIYEIIVYPLTKTVIKRVQALPE